MFSLGNLLGLALAGVAALYWWQSGLFKGRARDFAKQHCHQLDLQLLDESMVIVGIWPIRSASGNPVLRRTYQFEFSSTGDQRYKGELVLTGLELQSIELEAYKLPRTD